MRLSFFSQSALKFIFLINYVIKDIEKCNPHTIIHHFFKIIEMKHNNRDTLLVVKKVKNIENKQNFTKIYKTKKTIIIYKY